MKRELIIAATLAVWQSVSSPLAAQETMTLDTVVVTSGRVEEKLKDVTTNITVISGEAIEKSTAKDMIDVLQQQGLVIYRSQASLANVTIRGLSNGSSRLDYDSRVMVLLNGHRTGYSNLGLIGLNNIERIEIIRGPAAVQYGSSAMGGVINIITKRGVEGLSATAEVGLGSYGYSTEKVSLLTGGKGLDVALGFTHYSVDDDYSVGDGGGAYRHTSLKNNYSGDLDLGFSFNDNHRIGFHHTFNHRLGSENHAQYFPEIQLRPDSFTNQNAHTYSNIFTYEGSTEDKLFSWQADYIRGGYRYTTYAYRDPSFPSGIVYPNINEKFTQETLVKQFTVQGALNHERVSLVAGYDYIRFDPENHRLPYSTRVSTDSYSYLENKAGFLIGKLHLLDDTLVLAAGGRYDSFKNVSLKEGPGKTDLHQSKTNFTPSIGLAWTPVECLKLRANYAEGFLMPSPNHVNGGGIYYIPNPSLQPEESKTFEVGVDINWNYVDASLTYFHTDYTNKIASRALSLAELVLEPSYDPTWPATKNYKHFNYKGAVFQGVELAFGLDLGAAFNQSFRLRPYANLNWIKARNEDMRPAFIIPQDPRAFPNVASFTGSYGLDFSHPDYHLEANINAAYVGKHWTRSYLSGRTADWVRHGGFTMVDLSVSKRVLDFEDKGHLTLKAKINNLTDAYIDYTLGYPQPGRNFYVGLRYDFN